jgi:hypothetical protein
MDALKASMQKQGQAKVRDAVRKRMGKAALKEEAPRAGRQSPRTLLRGEACTKAESYSAALRVS